MENRIFEEILDVWVNSDNSSPIWDELAKKYGEESGEKIRSKFKRARQKAGIPSKEEYRRIRATNRKLIEESQEIPEEDFPNFNETIEIHSDGSITSDKLVWMSDADSKTPDFLLKAHGYLPSAWELVQAQSTLWHGLQKGGVERTLLYRSKVVAKPRVKPVLDEDSLNRIFAGLETKNFRAVPVKQKRRSINGKVLILPISDLHLGLLSTAKVCGNEYNLEIAEKLFFDAISETINKLSDWDFEEIVLVLGNDFLNSDNISNTTSHGTPQDSVDFWYSLVDKAIEIIIRAVNLLREISIVNIYYVPSNHDEHSVYTIMKAIEMYYKNVKDVRVDTSPLPRKYYNFGKNLIAFSHDMDIKRSLEVISAEAKEYWSDIDNAYLMLGHLHTAMQFQKMGMLEIYRLPTISGTSRWANGKGFIQSKKMNQAFILDAENGIETVMNVVVGK